MLDCVRWSDSGDRRWLLICRIQIDIKNGFRSVLEHREIENQRFPQILVSVNVHEVRFAHSVREISSEKLVHIVESRTHAWEDASRLNSYR